VTAPIFLEKNHKYKTKVNRASSVNTKLNLTTGRSFVASSDLLTTSSVQQKLQNYEVILSLRERERVVMPSIGKWKNKGLSCFVSVSERERTRTCSHVLHRKREEQILVCSSCFLATEFPYCCVCVMMAWHGMLIMGGALRTPCVEPCDIMRTRQYPHNKTRPKIQMAFASCLSLPHVYC
jgi:hypothetical protein